MKWKNNRTRWKGDCRAKERNEKGKNKQLIINYQETDTAENKHTNGKKLGIITISSG